MTAFIRQMDPSNPRIIKSLFLFVITISVIQCHLFKEKEFGQHKIVDHLSHENIVESPFKDLIKKFEFVEVKLTGKWKYLLELSNNVQEVWGISSKHPILGDQELKAAEETELFRNGKKVKKLTNTSHEGWSWLKTSEILKLKQFEGFNKDLHRVLLTHGKSLKFERFLADGQAIIDIYAVNRNWKTFRPHLKIFFNNREVKDIKVIRKKWFRIKREVKLGKHVIEIQCVVPKAKDAILEKDFLSIGMVKILNSSDILLLSKPQREKKEPPKGKFHFKYYTYEFIPGVKKRLFKIDNLLYLYNLKNKYPIYDLGIKDNPYMIKRKIKILNKQKNSRNSQNSILAPPRTEFTIPLRIPPRGILEFEYGFLNVSKKPRNITNFKIIIRDSEADWYILDKNLTPESTEERLSEKIDLSSYAGKKVKLSFITEDVTQRSSKNDVLGSIPIWINPMVYQPAEENDINIILISLDTLRPDHLSCYGYDRNTSPTIDHLAEEGVHFLNTYSTTSWTLPSHISMLTSLNCTQHQIYNPHEKMRVDIKTLADFLRVNDYFCAAFTGGGYLNADYGFCKGFDDYQELKLLGEKALRYDEAELLAKNACQWLYRNKDKKFFLFLHTYQPHAPYANLSALGKAYLTDEHKWDKVHPADLFQGQGRFETSFSKEEKDNIVALYDGEIKYTDTFFVKAVLDYLKKFNIYDKTMIILTSDHGEEFYDHDAWLHDHTIYEEGIRIPLIIKFPYFHYNGKKIKKIARITDIMPTILDFLKINSNSGRIDGKSLLPLIEGKEKNDRTFFCELALWNSKVVPTLLATNKGNLKLILNRKILSPYVERVSLDFKEIMIELYDLAKDPKEKKNLAQIKKYSNLCSQLIKKMEKEYKKIEKKRTVKERVTLDKDLKERLRALGYLR